MQRSERVAACGWVPGNVRCNGEPAEYGAGSHCRWRLAGHMTHARPAHSEVRRPRDQRRFGDRAGASRASIGPEPPGSLASTRSAYRMARIAAPSPNYSTHVQCRRSDIKLQRVLASVAVFESDLEPV